MCGIVAYIGSEQARPVLLEGLKRLEYRGYDSAGMAVLNNGLHVARTVGRVRVLEQQIDGDDDFEGTIGIAHTRWATHGGVTEANAHPHVDDASLGHGIVLVHNGIIENYAALRTYLLNKGHTFASETDTEVLTHLIGELYEGDLEAAVRSALREIEGAYAIAVMSQKEPDVLVAARQGSPLLIGVSEHGYIIASDAQAIVGHTSRVLDLDEEIVARITRDSFHTADLDNVKVTPQMRELEVSLDQIELGDYPHYMLKEIMEQPLAVRRCLRGRIDASGGEVILGGLVNTPAI